MTALAFLAYLAPLALIGAGLVARNQTGLRPLRALAITRWASLFALAAAAGIVAAVTVAGPLASPILGANGLGLQVRLDPLSAMMVALVGFVGAVVIQFSRNYMDGDDRQGPFLGGLCLVLGAVTFLVLSGNILQLLIGWTATSLALHRMLLFYADRPGARLAARKKFIVARVGDVALIGAAALLYNAFGTGEIAQITANAVAAPAGAIWAAGLIAIAALLKSAAFPTHGWLTEVMETPTPVSALLHAGVINAGGFLVIRFADLMLASPGALHLLAIVGGATAAIASLVMITQSSVKVGLAWSTVAQMGFMMLQCGFGAFTAAALHIVAHSLYKAHAFLNAGSVVDQTRAMATPPVGKAAPLTIALALAGSAVTVFGIGWAFGVTTETKPALVVLGAILVMGLTHFMLRAAGDTPRTAILARTGAASVGVATLYFSLQWAAETLLAPMVPLPAAPGPVTTLLMVAALALFALVAVIQLSAPHLRQSPGWARWHHALRNGFYANAYFNRLVGGAPRPKHI